MITGPARISSAVGTDPTSQFTGLYLGSVVSVNDPLVQSRVTLYVPQVLGTAVSNWAMPIGNSSILGSVVTGQIVYVTFIGGDRNQPAYTPITWPNDQTVVSAPSIVFGTPVTNSFPVPVMVTVSGGSITQIAINGQGTGLTSGAFVLRPGGTITLTGSGASWFWFRAV